MKCLLCGQTMKTVLTFSSLLLRGMMTLVFVQTVILLLKELGKRTVQIV